MIRRIKNWNGKEFRVSSEFSIFFYSSLFHRIRKDTFDVSLRVNDRRNGLLSFLFIFIGNWRIFVQGENEKSIQTSLLFFHIFILSRYAFMSVLWSNQPTSRSFMGRSAGVSGNSLLVRSLPSKLGRLTIWGNSVGTDRPIIRLWGPFHTHLIAFIRKWN